MTSWTALGLFLHANVFFVLSLTVGFLRYRSRRIVLTRKILWLGIFAFLETCIVWNDLLTPLFAPVPLLPAAARTALLACGYAFLLAFGIQTLLPKNLSARSLQAILIGAQLAWLLPYGIAMLVAYPQLEQTALIGEVLARYLFAFPGGLLTGLGIRRQSYQTLEPAWREHIRQHLRTTEAMSAAFGVLNVALVPAAPFFPANWLNVTQFPLPTSLIWAAVGALWMLGLLLTFTTIQTQIEQWIENVERLQTIAADRERISRELHDGIIQSIYAAGLMLESTQHLLYTEPHKADAQLRRIMENLNQTIQDIRRYIFDLRSDMPDDDLEPGIRRLLRDFHVNTLLETDFNVEGEPPRRPLAFERRRHLFQIMRETLANTARHAHAHGVTVNLTYGAESLEVLIHDDGVGMEAFILGKGHGLRNIRERARLLDGKLKIESAPGAGVTLHLNIPY
ncbi:MAG: sensor histidine kinase [Anaerolineae bacterium]|nr:sensor histidine kinase [Anaerolineae bacterium]